MSEEIKIPDETARAMQGMFDLLGALKLASPELAAAFDSAAARVTLDTNERVILVSLVDETGRSRPLVAIQADPFDRAGFGTAGVPTVAAFGLYDMPSGPPN